MILKRHLLAALLTSLTLSFALAFSAFAQKPVHLEGLKDSYPDRQALLDSSFNLCSEALPQAKISAVEASRMVQKHLLKTPSAVRINYDSSGWSIDFQFAGESAGFLRLQKSTSFFNLSYRQKKSDIEGIASVSLSNSCQQLEEARFTYFNSALRPIQRLKINSQYQKVQSVTMEEPVREIPAKKISATPPVRIGIIDSGIDYNHVSLIDKSRPMLGIDLTNPARPPYDYTNTVQNELMGKHFCHGTAVADIASRNVDALIIPVRTANQSTLNGAAVEYLAKQRVRIVNISQGTSREADWLSFKIAVQNHPEMLFIVSSGNDSQNIDQTPVYPSSFDLPNMLVVASINSQKQLSEFSNYGPRHVHLAALGENINAAQAGGGQWTVNGTSFSAPTVTNVAAKMLSEHPSLKASELRSLLIQKAKQVPELQDKVQYGVLQE
jgi:subtilisin family serine protease